MGLVGSRDPGRRDPKTGSLSPSAAGRQDTAGRNGAPGAEKAPVHPLWDELQSNPDAHPNLPSVGTVGDRHGPGPLPEPDWPIINVRLQPFGAAGDGVRDDTQALRRALAAVGAGGGIVYLPDGTYRISEALLVNKSRTIIRGQSRLGTKLLFSRPLGR